ncbi:PEP/pyruvate-binding domain-containing protein [Sandaracinus amylolyticus]|uniref:Pyruvate,phosphate dikinase n=1 Tax=Sandaracinus amylolyticus TaxID=927083 RepID=A0A0F6SFA4_9BACT|nr:PEP/pyruvate-binding domain-containing protein [Sandaracinus amylolyticus]AKF06599.1 Pyruvate,phosphate dikinase [Sandaracinus amylolyticus]
MQFLVVPGAGAPADVARVGAKAAGLIDASNEGLPVPPFFVLSIDLFRAWRATGALPAELDAELDAGLEHLARATGKRLGDASAPLIVSVRSGAPVSMPGMLDTLLDVGATSASVDGLAAQLGDRAVALDVRRRFLESWGAVVGRLSRTRFDPRAGVRVAARATTPPPPITPADLEAKIARHEQTLREAGVLPPDDARAQLRMAIEAILASWDRDRARDFRATQRIDDALGTAVVVQAMVFGNASGASGSGVAFTRHPVTGEKHLFGEYLPRVQGDEVVGGRASPAGLSAAASGRRAAESLERQSPTAFADLERIAMALEARYGDAQDLEITVEHGTLWLLQVRTAKRSPRAAIRVAVDLVREGRIDRETALARLDPRAIDALVSRALPPDDQLPEPPLTIGVPASPGAVSGRAVYDPTAAVELAARGEAAILIRPECSPEDAPGIRAAAGVLTSSGGLTSHAAVIARALGRPCIVSASEVRVDVDHAYAEVRRPAGVVVPVPETITLDGATGRVFAGALPLATTFALPEAREVLEWARDLATPGWEDAIARLL